MIFTVWDSSRSPCGIEGIENFTMKDYKYLYFPSPFVIFFIYYLGQLIFTKNGMCKRMPDIQ